MQNNITDGLTVSTAHSHTYKPSVYSVHKTEAAEHEGRDDRKQTHIQG